MNSQPIARKFVPWPRINAGASCMMHLCNTFGSGPEPRSGRIRAESLNRYTTARTVQGHCAALRAQVGASVRPKVVIAYDVRAFKDFREAYISTVETPFFGLTSRHLAECAAEVYAANGIDVLIQQRSDGRFMSTPELSHAVRYCGADGGLNISASHNPPDDNGQVL